MNAERARSKHAIDWVARMLAYARGHDRKSPSYQACDLDRDHIEWLFDVQSGLCGWTGVQVVTDQLGGLESVSLDRIDGSRGCVKFNVMLTCLGANLARNLSTMEDMQKWVELVKASEDSPAVRRVSLPP